MKPAILVLSCAHLVALSVTPAMADCQSLTLSSKKQSCESLSFAVHRNRQTVRDLRDLRDAAITLWSDGRHEECERLLGTFGNSSPVPR